MVAPVVMLKNAGASLALLALVSGTAALAQRDPAYASARASGAVGERMDGYLGVVSAASPQVRNLVADINIKRKQIYFEQATEHHVTAEQYAFSAGCTAIVRTVPGEKYQAPDGSWETRTGARPRLHPDCPG
ncbi:MAG: YdbL family protein [Novosphingobium sp.]